MEQNKRKHMCSMIKEQFEDKATGPTAALGENFYVKEDDSFQLSLKQIKDYTNSAISKGLSWTNAK